MAAIHRDHDIDVLDACNWRCATEPLEGADSEDLLGVARSLTDNGGGQAAAGEMLRRVISLLA